jgi:hypothetical protein
MSLDKYISELSGVWEDLDDTVRAAESDEALTPHELDNLVIALDNIRSVIDTAAARP